MSQVAQSQVAAQACRVVGKVSPRQTHGLNQGPRVGQQHLTGGGQTRSTRASTQELSPQLALQSLNALSERRLGYLERGCGAAEVSCGRDLQERIEMFEVNRTILLV